MAKPMIIDAYIIMTYVRDSDTTTSHLSDQSNRKKVCYTKKMRVIPVHAMFVFIVSVFAFLFSSSYCQQIHEGPQISNQVSTSQKNGLEPNGSATEKDAIVQTSYGKLRGGIGKTRNGKEYFFFRGIPYAEPPIGPLRFKPPVMQKSWEGIRDTRDVQKETHRAPQIRISNGETSANEDCLYLNVYTPQLTGALKPVIVYIHGGAFQYGNGHQYGPKYLLDHDLVLVTFNYRLGALGFLNLDIEGAAGNMGLKDQAQVLKWVKEEIHNFGGDPNSVTISGSSAGGASVTYHMVSPLSKGLFHKAIAESGTLFSEWAFMRHHYERGVSLGKYLGFNGTSKEELLNYLMAVPAEKIVQFQDSVVPVERRIKGYGWVFVPSIETVGGDRFLSSDPHELIINGQLADVPFITGITSHEGFFWIFEFNMRRFNIENLYANMSLVFEDLQLPASLTTEQISTLAERVKKHYFKEADIEYARDAGSIVDFYGDILFDLPAFSFLQNLKEKPRQNPVFVYFFSVDTPHDSFVKLMIDKKMLRSNQQGAAHGAEVSYLFSSDLNKDSHVDPGGLIDQTITRMTSMWSNFAKSGNPSYEVTWKPAFSSDYEKIQYLNISDALSMGTCQQSYLKSTFKELFPHNQ